METPHQAVLVLPAPWSVADAASAATGGGSSRAVAGFPDGPEAWTSPWAAGARAACSSPAAAELGVAGAKGSVDAGESAREEGRSRNNRLIVRFGLA